MKEAVAKHILQLNETKQAIKTAIENKGQDLTDIPFTQYAEKIAQIAGGKKFTTGTVVFTSSLAKQTITHNLGVKPSIFLLYAMITKEEMEFDSMYAWRYWSQSGLGGVFDFITGNALRVSQVYDYYMYNNSIYQRYNEGGSYYEIYNNKIMTDYMASYHYYRPGIEYRWIAIE